MENLTKQFTEFMIQPDEKYSAELNEYINMHNVSVSELGQSIMEMSLVSVLIEKGIITADELYAKMYDSLESLPSFEQMKKNYESLKTIIQCETEVGDFSDLDVEDLD